MVFFGCQRENICQNIVPTQVRILIADVVQAKPIQSDVLAECLGRHLPGS